MLDYKVEEPVLESCEAAGADAWEYPLHILNLDQFPGPGCKDGLQTCHSAPESTASVLEDLSVSVVLPQLGQKRPGNTS